MRRGDSEVYRSNRQQIEAEEIGLLANLVLHGLAATGSFRSASALDSIWLAGYLLLGFAALQPSDLRAVQSKGWSGMGRARLGLVLAAIFVPQFVLARDLFRRDLLGLNTVTIAAGVSTLVIAMAAVRLLRSLEARLSTLIFHSTDAIFLVDSDSRIAFASPSAEELWGRTATARVKGARSPVRPGSSTCPSRTSSKRAT